MASNTVNTGCMALIMEALIAVVKFRPIIRLVALTIMMPPSRESDPRFFLMSGIFVFSDE